MKDFNYFIGSKVCSFELCCFYNDIRNNKTKDFDKSSAYVDLTTIAVTLNNQFNMIEKLKNKIAILEKNKSEEIKN